MVHGTLPPVIVLSHYIWAALVFLCAVAVRRKARQSDIEMLQPFWKFFAVWSLLFFGPLAAMLHIGWLLDSSALLTAGYVLPHLFAFVAIGYLWRVQSLINFPSYEKYYKVFIAYGIVLASYGMYELPQVYVENGSFIFGPGSTFSALVPLGMAASALFIAGSSFYSAYIVSGASRIKLILIGIGTITSLVLASLFHNLGYPVLGEIANIVWIGCFMTVVYWERLTDLW